MHSQVLIGYDADAASYVKRATAENIKNVTEFKLALHLLPGVFPLSSSAVVVEKVRPASRIQSSFCATQNCSNH